MVTLDVLGPVLVEVVGPQLAVGGEGGAVAAREVVDDALDDEVAGALLLQGLVEVGTQAHATAHAVDGDDLPLFVMVTPADMTDRNAAKEVLFRLRLMHPEITIVWADSAYAGQLVSWAKTYLNLTIKTVSRRRTLPGSSSCPGAGSSNAPTPGLCTPADTPATTKSSSSTRSR
ncbi:hypothetical protein QFZ55_001068 [Streptomyces luteogriseus]|nr:hypothetical protein [Streptomyces luteogriseus]